MGFNPSNTSLIQQPSWIRRSTEGDETVLRLHWKLGYAPVQSGYFPLHDKLCFPSWTAKQRLQVLIPKEPHSIQLLDLVPSSKIWAKSISYLVDPFSSGHIFRTCSHSFYFFFLYLPLVCRAGLFKSPCIIWRDSWYLWVVLSVRCHQDFSDLNARFLKNMDSETKQHFPLSYYNLMLVLIPFYRYMFVPPCSLDLFSILTAILTA